MQIIRSRIVPLVFSCLALLITNLQAGRLTVSLDGKWEIEDSRGAEQIPSDFPHSVPHKGRQTQDEDFVWWHDVGTLVAELIPKEDRHYGENVIELLARNLESDQKPEGTRNFPLRLTTFKPSVAERPESPAPTAAYA